MFRGEFVGLNGGADFHAIDIEGLHRAIMGHLWTLPICLVRSPPLLALRAVGVEAPTNLQNFLNQIAEEER